MALSGPGPRPRPASVGAAAEVSRAARRRGPGRGRGGRGGGGQVGRGGRGRAVMKALTTTASLTGSLRGALTGASARPMVWRGVAADPHEGLDGGGELPSMRAARPALGGVLEPRLRRRQPLHPRWKVEVIRVWRRVYPLGGALNTTRTRRARLHTPSAHCRRHSPCGGFHWFTRAGGHFWLWPVRGELSANPTKHTHTHTRTPLTHTHTREVCLEDVAGREGRGPCGALGQQAVGPDRSTPLRTGGSCLSGLRTRAGRGSRRPERRRRRRRRAPRRAGLGSTTSSAGSCPEPAVVSGSRAVRGCRTSARFGSTVRALTLDR